METLRDFESEPGSEELPVPELLKTVLDQRYNEYMQVKYENAHDQLLQGQTRPGIKRRIERLQLLLDTE